jgi:hypothetical protein
MDELGAEQACVIACSKDQSSEIRQATLTWCRRKDNQQSNAIQQISM